MSQPAAAIEVGYEFPSVSVLVSREMISAYAAASYDFNPLHLDQDWMAEAEFGSTRFGEVIAHGLMIYSLVTRMLTDVVYPLGGWHERCEMRFTAPVRASDTVTTSGVVSHVRPIGGQLLYAATVRAERQDATVVAIGDAMGRVPIGSLRTGEAHGAAGDDGPSRA